MPANPNSPFGFQYVGQIDGSPPNFGNRVGFLASGNAHQIFTGDVLAPLAAGYLDVQSPVGGGAPIGGIAGWFSWNSLSQNRKVWQNWWPGNGDSVGANPVEVFYYAGPNSVFRVQALLGPITQASVGSNANYDVGAGGQTFGAGNKSSYSLTSVGAGASLPFKIYGLPNASTNPILVQAGEDPANPYNQVFVTINNLTA